MLASLMILASATLAAAWPAVLYSDVNCTSVVAAYSHLPEEVCINTYDVQSYRGSLGSEKEELRLFREKTECSDPKAEYIAVIGGEPQTCTFIYKHIGPFGGAKIAPVEHSDQKAQQFLQD